MRRLLSLLMVGSVVVVLCAVVMAIVILVGLGAGYCLHRLVPGIDLGLATLIGMLAFLAVAYAALQVLRLAVHTASDQCDDEDMDDDVMSDDQVEYVADQLTDAILDNLKVRRDKRGGVAARR